MSSSPPSPRYVWLIERGQPEQHEPTAWFVAHGEHWTTDAWKAAQYATREEAEAVIAEHFTSSVTSRNPVAATARAVEHGFG